MQTDAPVVWLLTDHKPGHRNQLKGIGNRLRVRAGAALHWINATEQRVPLWRALLGIAPAMAASLPSPALIIGAGTSTHRLLLALRRTARAKTVVLMKPSFPMRWADAVILPEHDGVTSDKRILTTQGVINSITPLARITEKPEALVLIGGPSRHFEWDDDVVFDQVSQLIADYPTWRWTISSSRRTPPRLAERLEELDSLRVSVVDPKRTHEDWLAHQLSASGAAWVTPDSMSMVCEAATSGVPTGLFHLSPKSGSRVAQGINLLVERGRVACWSDHTNVMDHSPGEKPRLWEADRATEWLIRRFLRRGKP
ncbi:MAG: mitochondrial fission ELM1 family protein [Marinobacter sp.]